MVCSMAAGLYTPKRRRFTAETQRAQSGEPVSPTLRPQRLCGELLFAVQGGLDQVDLADEADRERDADQAEAADGHRQPDDDVALALAGEVVVGLGGGGGDWLRLAAAVAQGAEILRLSAGQEHQYAEG